MESTREEWLNCAILALKPHFAQHNFTLPEAIRASCGWPSKGATSKRRVLGQCWRPNTSANRTWQIFISPVLDSPLDVLATLVHELCHTVSDDKHGPMFTRAARAVGLVGKPSATLPNADLTQVLRYITQELGPYPHARLYTPQTLSPSPTRLLRTQCPECGYIARVTHKWLSSAGAPICPQCGVQFNA